MPTPANRKEAFKWYQQASDSGSLPATQKLAHLYLEGIGCQKEEGKGYYLLATLALNGDAESRALLRKDIGSIIDASSKACAPIAPKGTGEE